MDHDTVRLILHPVDEHEARRIRSGERGPGDSWAADYPFDGDRVALVAFLRATEQHGEQRPFGYYQIIRKRDGRVVGGIGFKGAPEAGVVEVGYGLAPSGRGHGFAAEALRHLTRIAADLGVTTIRADTTLENIASQRTLGHAGFHPVRVDAPLCYYETSVAPD